MVVGAVGVVEVEVVEIVEVVEVVEVVAGVLVGKVSSRGGGKEESSANEVTADK